MTLLALLISFDHTLITLKGESNGCYKKTKKKMASNNLVLAIEEAHHENNVDYMKLEQQLHFEKWKVNYISRRLRWVAKHYDLPNIVVTEEELEEQIRKTEN